MQQENNWIIHIISSASTALLTLAYFVVLGGFYIAKDHSIAENIIVWCVVFVTAYYSYFAVHLFAYLATKRKIIKPLIFDGWAILAGCVIILIVCLLNSKEWDDYLYVSIMGGVSAVIGTLNILFAIIVRKRENKN